MSLASAAWNDVYFTARDGLRLHVRRYRAPGSRLRPVLCLAGLSRNSKDFHDLAVSLSTGPSPRTVWALDARGRGLSDFDPDWKNYVVPIEMLDVLDLITTMGITGCHVVGTSRGGILAMVMAVARPTSFSAVVLNDIGPVIEQAGLNRISTYVGRMPLPSTWEEARGIVAGLGEKSFPNVTPAQWDEVARAWFNDKNGKPSPGYDINIGKAMSVKDGPIPALWPQFQAMTQHPLLIIRGEHSDILSVETVRTMQSRHPNCAVMTVPGEGHAPLLKDARTNAAIASFLQAVDAGESVAARVM
jgi:pimeloyl-ACP methyl ester carboxylesterase